MLGEIFPRNGFCHLWALIVFEICSGEVITRNLRILNGCRFAAKYFDLYTMKIFRPSEPFSDSSSLSSTCMPTWGLKRYFRFCPGFISIHVPQFKEYSRRRTFSYKVTKTSRLLWPPNSSQRQDGGQLFSSYKKLDLSCASCDDNDHFLYISSRLLAMQKPWLQAFSDCISDMTDLLDPITTAMQFRVIDSNGLYWLSHEVHLHVVR